MAFSYNELYKRYEELKKKNKELSKSTQGDISKYKKTIKRLKRQVNDDTRIIEKKNKQWLNVYFIRGYMVYIGVYFIPIIHLYFMGIMVKEKRQRGIG